MTSCLLRNSVLNYINLTVAYLSIVLHLEWQRGKQIQQISCRPRVLASGRSGQAEKEINRSTHTRFPVSLPFDCHVNEEMGTQGATRMFFRLLKWGVRAFGSHRKTLGNCSSEKRGNKFRWETYTFYCLYDFLKVAWVAVTEMEMGLFYSLYFHRCRLPSAGNHFDNENVGIFKNGYARTW